MRGMSPSRGIPLESLAEQQADADTSPYSYDVHIVDLSSCQSQIMTSCCSCTVLVRTYMVHVHETTMYELVLMDPRSRDRSAARSIGRGAGLSDRYRLDGSRISKRSTTHYFYDQARQSTIKKVKAVRPGLAPVKIVQPCNSCSLVDGEFSIMKFEPV